MKKINPFISTYTTIYVFFKEVKVWNRNDLWSVEIKKKYEEIEYVRRKLWLVEIK